MPPQRTTPRRIPQAALQSPLALREYQNLRVNSPPDNHDKKHTPEINFSRPDLRIGSRIFHRSDHG